MSVKLLSVLSVISLKVYQFACSKVSRAHSDDRSAYERLNIRPGHSPSINEPEMWNHGIKKINLALEYITRSVCVVRMDSQGPTGQRSVA